MMTSYPFTPELLDSLPEPIAELFRGLEDTLLSEICSRLRIADNLNEVTIQDIRALRSHGIQLEDIKKAIAETDKISMDKLDKLFDDVVERNQAYYIGLVNLAQITEPEQMVDAGTIEAIRRQTSDEFRNITQSMGFLVDNGRTMLPPARAYQWALDSATLQIQSGAISYNQAIGNAVKQLADSGLKRVEYESGHVDQIDVAARRAVMTGVSQVCAKYTEQAAEYLETDYFEISAHIGARDIDGPMGWENHKAWQGRVYSIRAGDKYPNIYEKCGLGYVDGLEGANCRHRRFPFIDGISERAYTDEQLANIDPPPFEYEGRTYTAYQATQKQRQIERTIRKQKRLKNAYTDAGLEEDAQAANIRLRRLNTKYKEFSKAAGLPEQRERMNVLYPDNEIANVQESMSKPIAAIDVTDEYFKSATPGSHAVQDLNTYVVNGVSYKVDGRNVQLDYSPHEREVAEIIEKELGGEIYMVPRINNPGSIKTPDYIFRGKNLDLKSPTGCGKETFYGMLKDSAGQASDFVFDITNCPLEDEEVQKQIDGIYTSKHRKFVDTIILIKNGKIIKILRRK